MFHSRIIMFLQQYKLARSNLNIAQEGMRRAISPRLTDLSQMPMVVQLARENLKESTPYNRDILIASVLLLYCPISIFESVRVGNGVSKSLASTLGVSVSQLSRWVSEVRQRHSSNVMGLQDKALELCVFILANIKMTS